MSDQSNFARKLMAKETDKQPIMTLDGIAKAYALFDSKMQRVRHALFRSNNTDIPVHHALYDVNLSVYEGEMIGILGLNGAGKSTLLQIMTGVLQPTSGQIQVNGSIAALLELGAGFNPEWTGRENARFQLQLAGASNDELDSLVEEVIEFADIGIYFDQPVRTYSSGMFVRLAFAASIVRRPDLLIIDEALAVGDARFQNKCYNRINELKAQGTTIILVSHSMEVVLRFCDRAAVLHGGTITFDGDAKGATEYYLKLLYGDTENADTEQSYLGESDLTVTNESATDSGEQSASLKDGAGIVSATIWDEITAFGSEGPDYYNSKASKAGTGNAKIGQVAMFVNGSFQSERTINSGDQVDIHFKIKSLIHIERPSVGLTVKTIDGIQLDLSASHLRGIHYSPMQLNEERVFTMSFKALLGQGDYFIDLGISETVLDTHRADDWRLGLVQIFVKSSPQHQGPVDLNIVAANPT